MCHLIIQQVLTIFKRRAYIPESGILRVHLRILPTIVTYQKSIAAYSQLCTLKALKSAILTHLMTKAEQNWETIQNLFNPFSTHIHVQCQNMNMSYVKCKCVHCFINIYYMFYVLWNSLLGMFIKIPTVFSITFLKSKKIQILKHICPQGFQIKNHCIWTKCTKSLWQEDHWKRGYFKDINLQVSSPFAELNWPSSW